MERNDILDKAIDYENKTYFFYIESAKRFPENEKLFNTLAMEENRHRRLLGFFKESDDFDASMKKAYDESIMGAVQGDAEFNFKGTSDELIEKAISLEKTGFDIYADMLENTDDEKLRHLLKTLMDMEMDHVKMLKERLV